MDTRHTRQPFSCNLRQGFKPFGKSPATCAGVSNRLESLLQLAPGFQTVWKVPCNLTAENSGLFKYSIIMMSNF
jgi:hypothetical protein